MIIHSRCEWRGGLGEGDTLSINIEEYKIDSEVGTGVYSQDLDISFSIRLPNLASFLQAKILSIEKAGEFY